MTGFRRIVLACLLALLGVAAVPASTAQGGGGAAGGARGPEVLVLRIEGAIGPATVDYVRRGLVAADRRKASAVVLRMDTPGGLDTSMREIIRDMLASPVPVLVWVGPSGARAASAGTYIAYASHVAAMAPGTSIGAATPVAIGTGFGAPADRERDRPAAGRDGGSGTGGDTERRRGGAQDGEADESRRPPAGRGAEGAPRDARPMSTAEAKAVNDAVAYIRSLAEMRGRNADWGEAAVREAASLPATEARTRRVVDLVSASVPDLLAQAHGREVELDGRPVRLDTRDAAVSALDPDWRVRLLAAITHPSIAVILMMIGVYGLLFEFMSPGALYPGTIGAVCLLVGLYSLSALPVNYAAVALLLLGLALLVAEALTPAFGILGIGGTVALALGATILIDTDLPEFRIPWALAAGLAAVGLAFVVVAGGAASRARRFAKATGAEGMLGQPARVLEWDRTTGHVWVAGERWRAASTVPLSPGQQVRVASVEGLTLHVTPVE